MAFAIGMIKLVATILVYRTVDGYEISSERVTWNEIDSVCKQHFLPEQFTDEVKDGLTKLLPSNEKFWLRAKSRPTNYLIWKGCHHLRPKERFTPKKLKSNSISSCISKTNCTARSTLALKGDSCICIKERDSFWEFDFLPQNSLDQTCPGNLNEDCGCSGNVYSVYVLTKNSRGVGDCILESSANEYDRANKIERNCDDKVTNIYRCWNGKGSGVYTAKANMSWLEARQLCKNYSLELGGDKRTPTQGAEYWTPERSSFELMWTASSGDSYKQCVAVIKDNRGVLQLTENSCSSTFRAVCARSDHSNDKFAVQAVIIATVGGAATLCVVILIIVCWRRRNRLRKRSSTVNNRFYDQVVCSTVPTKELAQPKRGQDSNQGESSNAYQAVDIVGENNATSNEGHYDVTFTHSNNTHTLPAATGNIYDRCYGKSTGTPVDRTAYNDAESDHCVGPSTETDQYDTTRNVLSKSNAKLCSEEDYSTVINTNTSNNDA